jgi:hypothetical protein
MAPRGRSGGRRPDKAGKAGKAGTVGKAGPDKYVVDGLVRTIDDDDESVPALDTADDDAAPPPRRAGNAPAAASPGLLMDPTFAFAVDADAADPGWSLVAALGSAAVKGQLVRPAPGRWGVAALTTD